MPFYKWSHLAYKYKEERNFSITEIIYFNKNMKVSIDGDIHNIKSYEKLKIKKNSKVIYDFSKYNEEELEELKIYSRIFSWSRFTHSFYKNIHYFYNPILFTITMLALMYSITDFELPTLFITIILFVLWLHNSIIEISKFYVLLKNKRIFRKNISSKTRFKFLTEYKNNVKLETPYEYFASIIYGKTIFSKIKFDFGRSFSIVKNITYDKNSNTMHYSFEQFYNKRYREPDENKKSGKGTIYFNDHKGKYETIEKTSTAGSFIFIKENNTKDFG